MKQTPSNIEELATQYSMDHFYCDEDTAGNREVWEPFENEDDDVLEDMVESLKDHFIAFYNKAKGITS